MIYDFYYSEKHEAYVDSLNLFDLGFDIMSSYNLVNGIKYTEMIPQGITPMTNHFGDLKLVLTAEESEVKINY